MKKFIAVVFLTALIVIGAHAFTLTFHFYDAHTYLPIQGVTVFRYPELPLPNQWGPSDWTGTVVVPNYIAGTYYWDLDDAYWFVEWLQTSVTYSVVNSDEELIVFGELWAVDGPPDPPSDLLAQAMPGNQIALTWCDNSDNESGFVIERRMENTAWEFLADVYMDTQSYLDAGLTSGVTYYYRVYAYGFDNSDYSNIAQATSSPLPGPADISITQISASQVRLEWSAAVSCTHYKVYAASEPLPQDNPGWIYIGQTSDLLYDTSSNAQRRFFLVKGVAP